LLDVLQVLLVVAVVILVAVVFVVVVVNVVVLLKNSRLRHFFEIRPVEINPLRDKQKGLLNEKQMYNLIPNYLGPLFF